RVLRASFSPCSLSDFNPRSRSVWTRWPRKLAGRRLSTRARRFSSTSRTWRTTTSRPTRRGIPAESIPATKPSVSWDYRLTERAIKQLRKLGPEASRRVIGFLDERIRGSDDPRQSGKALRGDLGEFWRYRLGDYR